MPRQDDKVLRHRPSSPPIWKRKTHFSEHVLRNYPNFCLVRAINIHDILNGSEKRNAKAYHRSVLPFFITLFGHYDALAWKNNVVFHLARRGGRPAHLWHTFLTDLAIICNVYWTYASLTISFFLHEQLRKQWLYWTIWHANCRTLGCS